MTPDLLIVSLVQAAPRVPEQQLLDLDGTIFVMLGLFLVMLIAMTQLVWKPYLKVRHERDTRIDGYREDAARMAADAETRMARVQKELADTRRLGAGELAMARAEAQAREQTLLAEANAAAQRALADARNKLDATLTRQRANLQAMAEDLGKQAAGKILGRGLS